MLDPGTYRGYLKSAVTSEAKTGNAQIVLQFSIAHRWTGNEWQQLGPEDRRVYMSLTDAAWPYTSDKLKSLECNSQVGRRRLVRQLLNDPGRREESEAQRQGERHRGN